VPTMNPDGFANIKRQNDNGKDLNQNFPNFMDLGKKVSDLKVNFCLVLKNVLNSTLSLYLVTTKI
jgi:hypothetical protein